MRWRPNFTSTYRGVNARLAQCLNSVLNVKALAGAFNQKKALVGAFSVIVQQVVEPMDRFAALVRMLCVMCSRKKAAPVSPVAYYLSNIGL